MAKRLCFVNNNFHLLGKATTTMVMPESSISIKEANRVRPVSLFRIEKENQAPLSNISYYIPQIVPSVNMGSVHPLVKKLFSKVKIPQVPLAGRLKCFKKSWEILTKDPKILEIIEGYCIPLLEKPVQRELPNVIKMNQEQHELVNKEIKAMLEKGAISKVNHVEGEFLSNVFLVGKKDGGNRPVINLKNLNQFVPYEHFKMEGLHCLKDILKRGDYMCKIDLKDAYFSVALNESSRKLIRFKWGGNLYEFLCLCFGLGPAPRIFTKLLKIPIAILRRLNIRVIIYLDVMLIMGHSIDQARMGRDTVVFLLQHLGFVINLKKSVFTPIQQIEFLGMLVDSVKLSLSLTKEKREYIQKTCQELYNCPTMSILQLTKLIGLLSSTAQAVLPARLQYRYLQQVQLTALRAKRPYQFMVTLDQRSREELLWWARNLDLTKGKLLIQPPAQMCMQTDASRKGWGASCQGVSTGGKWSEKERTYHINILELIAVKLALLTFINQVRGKNLHLQVDNMTALSYILKQGGTGNVVLLETAKEIWKIILEQGITITAEYLPSSLNVIADWESRHVEDPSDWKLDPIIFQKICLKLGNPSIDLFASRLCHQIPQYMAWKPDPHSLKTDAMSQTWSQALPYAFPPFSLIMKVLRKVEEEKVERLMLITPTWHTQVWYPVLLQMSIMNPVLLPCHPNLLLSPTGGKHKLVLNKSPRLLVWMVSGNVSLRKGYQDQLQFSSPRQEERVLTQITRRPGGSGLAGVLGSRLIPFQHL